MTTTDLTRRTTRMSRTATTASWLLWPALLAVAILVPVVIRNNYWLQVTVGAEVAIVAAVGLYVTFGMSGQVSLGQAGFYAIGGYAAALLVTQLGFNFGLSVVVGTLLAAAVGLLLGIPALRLRGHYLALATLGFGQVVALLLINWTSLTGGAIGIRNIVAPLVGGFELRTVADWARFIGIVTVIAIFVVQRLRASSYGRAMQAVRDSEVAAAAMGVSLSRTKVLAFTVGAAFAGLAGTLNAGFITYVSPGTYDLSRSVLLLAMVIVGGASSPGGAVIGAIVLTFLPEVLRPIQDYYLLVYGVLLLVMVAFVPGGIWNLVRAGVNGIIRIFSRRKPPLRETGSPARAVFPVEGDEQ